MKKILLFLVFVLIGAKTMAQWSSDPNENLQLVSEETYEFEPAILPDGSWYMYYNRPVSIDSVTPYLQYFDKDGRAIWNTPIEVAKERTLTYTVVNQYLLLDKDNNAIVGTQDLRLFPDQEFGPNAYTVYKIDQQGENLWEGGVSLHIDNSLPDFSASLKMIQLMDGSYVFAWQESYNMGNSQVRMQRVSADGQLLWGAGKVISMENTEITYPYLTDAGNNEFILVYAQGAMQEIYARKLDFDGNDVWAHPTLVYNGLLPSIPLWTWLTVIPADGGALVAWPGNDPEQPLLAWIKSDGTHAFTEAEEGLRMGYNDDYRHGESKLVFDKTNEAIYALWREFDPITQTWQRMGAQKISFAGELLWDPMGLEIAPLEARPVSFYSIQLGPKGSVMAAYMENVAELGKEEIVARAVLVSSEGDYIWSDTAVTITNTVSSKSGMLSTPMVGDQWIFIWSDNRDFDNFDYKNVYAQNLHVDGTLGINTVANENVRRNTAAALQAYPNPVMGAARIVFNNPEAAGVRIEILNLNGAVVVPVYNGYMEAGANTLEWDRPAGLASGMYLLRAVSGSQVSYGKIVLK